MSNIVQDIIQQMRNVKKELSIIDISEEELRQGVMDCTNSCFRKFILAKETNLNGIRNTLVRPWKSKEVKVFKVQTNVYHFFFKHRRNSKQLLEEAREMLKIIC